MGRRSKRRVQLSQGLDTERRASTRFALTLEVRYTILGGHAPAQMGAGRTVDLSSSGLRFNADRPLPRGQRIELYIDWPALLHGDVKLQLVLSGVVVRTNGTEVALRIERHDFKTRSVGQRSA